MTAGLQRASTACSRLCCFVSAIFVGLSTVTFAAEPSDSVKCISSSGAETRTIQNTFTGLGSAPCKTLYTVGGTVRIAADAKFDANKCIDIATRIKTNLERSGWSCTTEPSPTSATLSSLNPMLGSATPAATIAAAPEKSLPAAAAPAATTPPPAPMASPSGGSPAAEVIAVQQLLTGAWSSECIYSYPAHWKRNAELSDGEIDVYPPLADPLGKYNFVFSVGNVRFSHIERVFVAGASMPWEEVQTYAATLTKSEYTAAINLRSTHPGRFIPQHVLDSLTGGGDTEFEKRGTIDVQGRFRSGESFQTVTETVDVIFQDQLLIAAAAFLPVANAKPAMADEPFGFTFSCSASHSMNPDAFRTLCKALIEKATLNDHIADGKCEYGADGRLQFAKQL